MKLQFYPCFYVSFDPKRRTEIECFWKLIAKYNIWTYEMFSHKGIEKITYLGVS
jgi:hypothetical protein